MRKKKMLSKISVPIDTTTTSSDKVEENQGVKKNENVTSGEVKESTIENPLAFGEWGKAAKYVTKHLSAEYENTKYTDVPVRVTNVIRGEEATKIIKEWCDNQNLYKYEDPKTGMEWAVVEYQVDLSKLTFDKDAIGTTIQVDSGVKGTTGGGIKYNNMSYIVTTKDISSDDYVKEQGIYDGKFMVALPQGCNEYVIKFGNSNGSEAFFKAE